MFGVIFSAVVAFSAAGFFTAGNDLAGFCMAALAAAPWFAR